MSWRTARRIRRNPTRVAAIAILMCGTLLIGVWGTLADPGVMAFTATAPSVFVAVIIAIAYEQRVALAFGLLHAIMMAFALELPVGMVGVSAVGVAVAVWQLHEIRDRNTIIRMGVVDSAAMALATSILGLVTLPISLPAIEQSSGDAIWAGFGGLLVGGVTLFILPTIERLFDITTGMTLIELRDPKQPLLRQLQQRAPGTYNHSLNVASLGEAAADAIGADSLLTYVGALYHDIGKMNKPEYFVENQVPGINKHDKLSPAMSLLIIVGHVKDGMELAREFNLPRSLHHFIEGHHGTTLVEYFYHRAKVQAEEGEEGAVAKPEEIEYRYPGPRPRTPEVAILMLCDAVESASRSMSEPTPSRIEAMVREIATKRLMDGQFDECDLTLQELAAIVETVSKSLAAIFHGRVAYPGQKEGRGRPGGPETQRWRDVFHLLRKRPIDWAVHADATIGISDTRLSSPAHACPTSPAPTLRHLARPPWHDWLSTMRPLCASSTNFRRQRRQSASGTFLRPPTLMHRRATEQPPAPPGPAHAPLNGGCWPCGG